MIHLICESVEIFRHYDPKKIAISVSSSRSRGVHGTLAYVVPLRYIGGKATRKGRRRGIAGEYCYINDRLQAEHPEAKYLMTFLVPKFFRLTSQQRLETIVHELYHLHPTLRGDLRRFPAPHVHHGPTPSAYNRRVKELSSEVLNVAPFLEEHPLLKLKPEQGSVYRKKHYAIPKENFQPDTSSLLSRFAQVFLGGFLLFFAGQARALLPVQLSNSTMLHSSPKAGAEVVHEGHQGERYKAKKQSPDKKWVFIENSNGSGWVPKERLKVNARGASSSGQQGDKDFSVDKDIEAFDLTQSTATAKKSGSLYSEPSNIAEQFSEIQQGDAMAILGKSQSSDWYHVRLDITGEEGWVPAPMVGLEHFDRVNRAPPNTLQGNFAYGTDRLGMGGGISFYRNLYPLGLSGRLRDRLEVGGGMDFHYKAQISDTGYSVNLRTFHSHLGLRYLPTSSNGRFFGMVESGLSYLYTTVATTLTKAQLDATGLGRNASQVAIYLGGGLGVSIDESFFVLAQARLLMKSNIIVFGGASVGWRF